MEKINSDKYKLVPISERARSFKLGKYEHFKGGQYEVICLARDSEDKERELVVYQSLDQGHIWVGPLDMFMEDVVIGGKSAPRFRYLGI
ncbi:MAG TPA: DUF1653 domain-containing protein [Candidatus Paceibacterota bacterium]